MNAKDVILARKLGGSGGVSATEKTLLLPLFKNAIYTTDMTEALSQLEAYWNGSGGSGGGDTPPAAETLPSWIAEMQVIEFTPETDTNEAQTFAISMENEPNMVFINSDIETTIAIRDFVSAVYMKDTVGGNIGCVSFYSTAAGIVARADIPTDCLISANEVTLATYVLSGTSCYWRAGHTYKVYCVKTVCDASELTQTPSFAKETYALTFTPESKTNEAQTFSYEMENEPNAVLIFTDYTGDGSARDFYGAFCQYSSVDAAWKQIEIIRRSSATGADTITAGHGVTACGNGSMTFQTDGYGATCEYWLPDRTYYIIFMYL